MENAQVSNAIFVSTVHKVFPQTEDPKDYSNLFLKTTFIIVIH